MVAVIPTVASDETGSHSPPATDLPLGLIFLAIFILAPTCRAISWLLTSHGHPTQDPDHETLSSDDSFEPVMLDQIAPARTYRQWKAEMNHVVNIASGFNTCAICLEPMADEDIIRHLQCCHVFHSSCFSQWFFRRHDTCPICKSRIMPPS
ncbi:Resistance to glucose repression protein 1 [Fusarium oxysporum f. sp. albedinis]|nr:Resistance to glucose repression protein 1 [Fusarium oxysporum f. sp. albedinis]